MKREGKEYTVVRSAWEKTMLNLIWAIMILTGIIYGALSGHMEALTNGALDSAGEAISLCITMAGVMALWMGLMEIAKEAGIIEKLTKKIEPILRFLFPDIPKGHPSGGYIATNIIANILGLGWACTPAGLKAMEALAELEKERGSTGYSQTESETEKLHSSKSKALSGGRAASNEMCNFLILNISSLQLIPVNMIAYRSQYGSANPASIIVPAIVATSVSTLTAILYCKWKDGRRSK